MYTNLVPGFFLLNPHKGVGKMEDIPKYINEKEVFEITGRALSTLRNDRHNGRGIPYSKIGKSVRYNLDDVLNYMKDRKIHTDPV